MLEGSGFSIYLTLQKSRCITNVIKLVALANRSHVALFHAHHQILTQNIS